MMLGRNKGLLVLFMITLAFSSVDADEQQLKLKDSYTNAKSHPQDSVSNSQLSCFIENEEFVISYYELERFEFTFSDTTAKYEAVKLHIVPKVDVYDVMIIVQLYGTPDIPEKAAMTDDRVFYYQGKSSKDSVIKADDYSTKDSDGDHYFAGHNVKYRIQIVYKTTQDGGYKNLVYFTQEDESTDSLQRIDMLYAGTDGGVTFEQYFGNSEGIANGSSGVVQDSPKNHKIGVESVLQIALSWFVGMFLIQIGIGLFIKFQNAGAEFGAGMLIMIGGIFIVTAFSIAVGVIETVLDALGIFKKPVDWVSDGVKSIGDAIGL